MATTQNENPNSLETAAETIGSTKEVNRRTMLKTGLTTGFAALMASCNFKADPKPKGETEEERLEREKKEAEEKAAAEKAEKERLEKEAKEKAEKEAQEKAEKERIEKERQAQAQEARDRVQFGGGWAEYYRIPDPTGKNDDGQPLLTDADKQRYNNDITSQLDRFSEIAIEPAFVNPTNSPKVIARVDLTGVDRNSDSHRPLIEVLDKLGDSAYLTKDGKRVVLNNKELINFDNPKAVEAVKNHIQGMARNYGGVLVLGAGDFEQTIYADKANAGNQIANMRKALKEISAEVQGKGKKIIVGNVASVASGKGVSGFPEETSLAYFVAKECTKDLQFATTYNPANFNTYYGEMNLNFYANQEGANVRFSIQNQQDMSKEKLQEIKTAIGKTTGFYVGGPINPDKFYAGLYTDKDPKVKSVSMYVGSDMDFLKREDLDKNSALKNVPLKIEGPLEIPPVKFEAVDTQYQGVVKPGQLLKQAG